MIVFINDKFSAIGLESFKQTKKDTEEVKTLDGTPHIIINGNAIPYESINSIDPNAIESISVWKDQPEYPYGVIEIETKPGVDIYKSNIESYPETEDLKVIGYGTAKKKDN